MIPWLLSPAAPTWVKLSVLPVFAALIVRSTLSLRVSVREIRRRKLAR